MTVDATPSITLPSGVESGIRDAPAPMAIRGNTFRWGSRTYVMGIVNITPDSFSGDGLLATDPATDHVMAALEQGRRMADEGADILDVGGESTRPGHDEVDLDEELRRTIPVIRALRQALPDMPISIDTIKSRVAEAALDAGADLINDVSAVTSGTLGLMSVAAERGVPYIAMHSRELPRYTNLMAEVVADLQAAIDRALAAGIGWESLIVDPGIGFGKSAEQNLHVLAHLAELHILGRPLLLGASRKSTIGKVLDLPGDERLEGTLALTALGVAAGADIVRVHDVRQNLRAARMADAVHRSGAIGDQGWSPS